MKVAIIGVTGYGGLELIRLISAHPYIELHSIYSQSMHNYQIDEVYPFLKGQCELTIEEIDPVKIMAATELVFLATPSGVSGQLAQAFIEADFPVIDLSGDFRLQDSQQYEKWYPGHLAPPHVEKAVYGLAELNQLAGEQRLIANPGCYATGALLGLAPLVKEDVLDLTTLIIDGKSGLSGAGKGLSESSHFMSVQENMRVYKVNQHQHIPEIVQQLKIWNPKVAQIQFSTSLIPVKRGILLTMYVRPNQAFAEGLTDHKLLALYQELYQDKAFIRLQKEGSFSDLAQVVGSNYCDIGLTYNPVTNLITIVVTLDNLVKGAAGQAVQNLNLMYDFPEETGLMSQPHYL